MFSVIINYWKNFGYFKNEHNTILKYLRSD